MAIDTEIERQALLGYGKPWLTLFPPVASHGEDERRVMLSLYPFVTGLIVDLTTIPDKVWTHFRGFVWQGSRRRRIWTRLIRKRVWRQRD